MQLVRVLVLVAVSIGWARTEAADPWIISEFLADNSSTLADEDGDFEDWIELQNVSGTTADAGGWFLTDDPTSLTQWRLPQTNVPPGGFLVVFASGKDRAIPGAALHASFRLGNAGEYLALVRPDGETAAMEFTPQFPPQKADVSFGVGPSGELQFFDPPTPGKPNAEGYVDRVADTKFSVDRGFYRNPFDLVISCATPGVEIRYTTNGSPPTATSGSVYGGPLHIGGTTVVRAAAFRAGWLPSNEDTHTYLFTADIIRQSPTGAPPPGWPSSWGGNTRDYGMDPDVVNDPRYADKIEDALLSIPSYCITVLLSDLFDPTRGIYANAGQDGRSWERPMSLELVYPDGRDGFQIDGGLRIRGGYSRSGGNPKHAFRCFFRQEYGASRLRFPVFGEGGAEEFDGFDLRTGQNYSWSFEGDPRCTMLRDQFNRDVQLAMGHQAERGDFCHLFINGQYWGLYDTCERPEASYAATYFGGNKEDYDVIKVEAGPYSILATDGTMAGWTQLYNLVRGGVDDVTYRRVLGQNPDGTRNPDYPVYVDPVNLIDYMLVILYGGNLDAPISNFLGNTSPNNFFGDWNHASKDLGFQFFVHDAEHTLLNVDEDRTGPYPAGNSSVTKSNPQWLWQKLLENEEFRILAADRIQKHFYNGGVLTPEGARAIYTRRRDAIDRAMIAESARWGDSKRPSDPLTRDDWLAAVASNLAFIAGRSAVVLQQLRDDGLVPSVATPQFNQQGGPVNPGFGLLMAPTSATIYYTLDGSDPRRVGGDISPSARRHAGPISLTEAVTVKARTYQAGTWSALNEAAFLIIRTYKDLYITEIHYHPAASADLDADEFEFVELKNVGSEALDLSGVHFTNGVQFTFANGTRLDPGAFAVLVKNPELFAQRYPGRPVAGVYSGHLSNSGERLTLVHATGTPIFSVAYGARPPWPQAADGQGFSLVPVQANANAAPDDPANWRASSAVGGSPGSDDPSAGIVPVVINELLTHTDPPLLDAVELHNPNDVAANIGNWWLSDDRTDPKKYRIPPGRGIPARGFLVLTELDFNFPTNAPRSFSFDSHGDEAWLFSGDDSGNLTGYSDGFSFGAAENPVTFGRYTNSVGEVQFPPQSSNTLGGANTGPRIGPVVLNEIHYHPPDGDAEFVEIRNISDAIVALYDPLSPTHTWRINGVGFDFPPGLELPPGGLAVVVGSDPTAFRTRYQIDDAVPVLGPWTGVLQDGGETLVLERPDKPDPLPGGTVFVPYLIVDKVRYGERDPWPIFADGGGASLERLSPVEYADDPASWRASPGEPSPGFDNDGNRPPTIDAGPETELESAVFPAEVMLAGTASDDGLPVTPGHLEFVWSQVDGPGPVEFVDETRSNAVVRLPGTGEFTLRLTASDGSRTRSDQIVIRTHRPSESQTLVPAESTWRYQDDGSNQGTAWRDADFDDSTWPTGKAKLGFGDSDEVTTLRPSASGSKTTTFYFRQAFTLGDPGAVTGLTVRLLRDDGAMVYLNGSLVFRSNMPEGDVDFLTTASEVVGGADESTFFSQTVDPAVLRSGRNVLAVEVHQQNSGSSDVGFSLTLEAEVNPANRAPTVDAGGDQEIAFGAAARLSGAYQDDGLPSPPGVVRLAWQTVEGPLTPQFSATNVSSPTVTFPAAGRYTLRFVADDGALTASDELTVVVGADDYAAWRSLHFTPAELQDPAVSGDQADPDGDGQTNRGEFLSGTDPRVRASVLRLEAMMDADGSVRLRVPVLSGRTYSVLKSPTAGSGHWSVVEHIDPASCDCDVDVVDDRPGEAGTRFYRVVTPRLP